MCLYMNEFFILKIYIEEYEKLLNTLHKTKDELYEVNKQLSTLQNNETSARFNEQRYRQEYDILKKQNEWQNEQLKNKNEEFLQYKQQKVHIYILNYR